jgi:cytochrome c oxidase subunit 4
MSGRIVSKKVYFAVFAALIALTALTTGVAFIDLGAMNTVAALGIAVLKASLVVLFFMHLKWSSHLMRVAGGAALVWLVILIGLTLSDFATRNWIPSPTSWQTPATIQQSPR